MSSPFAVQEKEPAVMASYVLLHVNAFLDLRMLLAFRSCSKRLRKLYQPSLDSSLWIRLRPARTAIVRAAAFMTVAGVRLFISLYPGEQKGLCEKIGAAAHPANNLELVQWFWGLAFAGSHVYINCWMRKYFINALHAGSTRVVAWIMGWYGDAGSLLREHHPITNACADGNIELAEFILKHGGYELAPSENGAELLKVACVKGQIPAADWVLRRFPLALTFGGIFVMMQGACDNCAYYSVRWIAETFNLTREDLHDDYGRIAWYLQEYGPPSVYKWFDNRFAPDRPLIC